MAMRCSPVAPRLPRTGGVVLPGAVLLLAGFIVCLSAGLDFVAPRARPLAQPRADCAARGVVPETGACANAQRPRPWGASAAALLGLASVSTAALAAASRRPRRTAAEAVGLFFSTQTGNTETAAGAIAEAAGSVEGPTDIGEVELEDLAGYDGLIVGTPTWNTGADEYRSGTAWDDVIDDIKGMDLKGKPVAIFGCGDSEGYGDNFCDGIEELHETFKAAGAKMIGYVDSSAYGHDESKSDQGGKFLGCPFDEDNENDLTPDRAKAWVEQLKSEGMPL